MPMSGSEKLLRLFAEQRDALIRFLTKRTGSATLAEDMAQEVWLRVATTNAPVRVDHPRSYLFRIASNLAHDHSRRIAQGIEVEIAPETFATVADPAPSPEVILLHKSELARFIRATEALTPRCREVFLLAKVHELTYAEIAARLGISKNTVMVHISTALAQMDACFDPDAGAE